MDIQMLLKELEYLDEVVRKATRFLEDAPEGGLWIQRHENHIDFVRSTDGKYLSKKRDMQLIRTLAQKSYERKALRTAMEQKEVIERFLSGYRPTAFSDIVENWLPERSSLIARHGDFHMSQDEIAVEVVKKSEDEVDLARNLIGICEAFLEAKAKKP
ncbi:MAG: hypothetical protein MJ057_03975 [Sphaerochaetaceae bacterium]|nr:hypothetical protein [Sphaerochaetaceae bacterium]